MNCTNCSGSGMAAPMQQQNTSQHVLTSDQKKSANDILANYDSSNVSQEDFDEIFQLLEAAGISGGQSLKATTESAGFDFSSQMRESMMSGISLSQGMKPPAGIGMQSEGATVAKTPSNASSEYNNLLTSMLNDYDNGDANANDVASFIEGIKGAALSSTGNFISSRA